MLLDFHTHHPAPYTEGIVNIDLNRIHSIEDFVPVEGQYYSAGVHPWDLDDAFREYEVLKELVKLPCVVAIGECGVDLCCKTPLFSQMLWFKRQIELSEAYGKPLIIHSVKSADIIMGLRRDIKPASKWAVHGFRGKPEPALQLSRSGVFLGISDKFNKLALEAIPDNLILAETDDSDVSISDVISKISSIKGFDITEVVAENLQTFLFS